MVAKGYKSLVKYMLLPFTKSCISFFLQFILFLNRSFGFVAGFMPARSAARLDPVEAMNAV